MASENTAGYDSAKCQKYISIKGDGKRNNDGNGYGLNSPERAGDKGQNCNDNKNNSCQCFGIHIRNTQVDDVFRESHFAAGSLDHKGCKKNGENRKNICKAGKEQFHVPRKGHFFPRKIKNHTGNEEEYKMELEVLRKDMVAAMKAKDKVTKEAVSSLIAAVKKVAIDEGCRDEIKSDLVDRVILKELKTVKEQLDTCPESREDLKAEYQARYDVIAKYAPKQMDAAEIKAYLEEKFAEVLATKNKGQIMKAVMADLKGKADGKVINQVVAEICK